MDPLKALPWILGMLIVTSCVHEAGHAWAAWRLGDRREDIARRKSPFTFRHISLPFTILLPAVLLLTTGMMIGGARPVRVSTQAIGPWRMALVALAGPMGNFLVAILTMAVLVGLVQAELVVAAKIGGVYVDPIYQYVLFGIGLSFFLGMINLVPIPPLDGSRVVAAVMPESLRRAYYALSLPAAILFMGAFFYLGRSHPEKLSFIYDFLHGTVPRWTGMMQGWIQ